MSILDVPPPAAVFSIIVAEHQPHTVKHYRPPGRVIWFRIRPSRHFEVNILDGYKTEVAATVTIPF